MIKFDNENPAANKDVGFPWVELSLLNALMPFFDRISSQLG